MDARLRAQQAVSLMASGARASRESSRASSEDDKPEMTLRIEASKRALWAPVEAINTAANSVASSSSVALRRIPGGATALDAVATGTSLIAPMPRQLVRASTRALRTALPSSP